MDIDVTCECPNGMPTCPGDYGLGLPIWPGPTCYGSWLMGALPWPPLQCELEVHVQKVR